MSRYLSCFSLCFCHKTWLSERQLRFSFLYIKIFMHNRSFVCVIKHRIVDNIHFYRRVNDLCFTSFIPAYGTSSLPVANHDNHRQLIRVLHWGIRTPRTELRRFRGLRSTFRCTIIGDASSRFFENIDAYVLHYSVLYQRTEDSHQSGNTRLVPSILILTKAFFSGRREVCASHTVHTAHNTFICRTHQHTPQGLDISISKRPRLYYRIITL